MGLSCSPATENPYENSDPQLTEAAGPDFDALDSDSWVTLYDPKRASNGYTLDFYAARIPILFDMNGRIVHSWPQARVRSRVRLLENGSILAIGLGRAMQEYDWDGNLTWEFRAEGMLTHHDVIRRSNGNTMLVARRKGVPTDYVLEVDRGGEVVWEWQAGEHLAPFIPTPPQHPTDITHINSIQELPPNRWHAGGDRRFRPGNLLISLRNLSLVVIVDKHTGEVVWSYDDELDFQHEALMVPRGSRGAGHIQIFNNGYRGNYKYRASTILEIDPSDKSVAWQYERDGFFSRTGAVQQPLANGNVLITSTRGGRSFEVTRRGKIVWQWVPPFHPVRSSRYASDHTPQLAALATPRERAVIPAADDVHLDPGVYRFERDRRLRKATLGGRSNHFLAENDVCKRLLVPPRSALAIGYGLDDRKLKRAGISQYAVRFGITLEEEDSGRDLRFSEVVELSAGAWRSRSIRLATFGLEWVELCVEAKALGAHTGSETEEYAYWQNPSILLETAVETPRIESGTFDLDDLTPEEAAVRREHLEALGYTN